MKLFGDNEDDKGAPFRRFVRALRIFAHALAAASLGGWEEERDGAGGLESYHT